MADDSGGPVAGRRGFLPGASDLSGSLLRRTGNPDGLDGLTLGERFEYLVAAAHQRWGRRLSNRQIERDLKAGIGADGQPLAAPAPTVSASYLNGASGPDWNPTVRVLQTLVAYFACLDPQADESTDDQEIVLQLVATRLAETSPEHVEAILARAAELVAKHRAGDLPPNRLERRRTPRGKP
jgi:hypothetical protein